MEEESVLQNSDVFFELRLARGTGLINTALIQLRLENQFGAICKLIFISSGGLYESLQHCFWIKSPKSHK